MSVNLQSHSTFSFRLKIEKLNHVLRAIGTGAMKSKRFFAVIVSASLWLASGSSAQECVRVTPPSGDRVVGGNLADLGEWPSFAALRIDDLISGAISYQCGGAVIAPDLVLTAAHCTASIRERDGRFVWSTLMETGVLSGPAQVVIGASDVTQVSEDNVFGVAEIINHPDYAASTPSSPPRNDFALVRLDRPWDGPLARLDLSGDFSGADARAFVAGFGATGEPMSVARGRDNRMTTSGSSRLLYAQVPTVSHMDCSRTYGQPPFNTRIEESDHICAGYQSGLNTDNVATDSCQGDSGGPLVARDARGCAVQIGVVSWGRGCAERDAYGVYARIAAAAEFITQYAPDALAPLNPPEDARQAVDETFAAIQELLAPAEGRVDIRVMIGDEDRQIVRVGEEARFEITSEIAGRLIFLDINADGEVSHLFPNRFMDPERAGLIEAGATVTLPPAPEQYGVRMRFPVVEPLGPSRLVAIVTPEDFPIDLTVFPEPNAGERHRGIDVEAEPVEYAMNILEQIAQNVGARGEASDDEQNAEAVEDAENGARGLSLDGWALGVFDYVVEE